MRPSNRQESSRFWTTCARALAPAARERTRAPRPVHRGGDLPRRAGIVPIRAGVGMNVICASDAGFFVHMATMLLSLVSNNLDQSVRIFVLCDGKLPGKDQISAMLRSYQADRLFISIEKHFPQNLPLNTHVSRAAFARLLMD